MENRKLRKFSDSERLSIIEEHLSGASIYSIAKKYSLHSSQISEWMDKYGIERTRRAIGADKQSSEESDTIESLRKELQLLQKRLAEEKLRSAAYSKMIEVAEEMFRIEIRKKVGTKQSKR
jgi:transposase-like protein